MVWPSARKSTARRLVGIEDPCISRELILHLGLYSQKISFKLTEGAGLQ